MRLSKDKMQFEFLVHAHTGKSPTWCTSDQVFNMRAGPIAMVQFLDKRYPELPQPGQVKLLSGGPPCQGYSGLNRFREKYSFVFDNDNNRLLVSFFEYVEFLNPELVMFENVSGILQHYKGNAATYIECMFARLGYQWHFVIDNTVHFGMPQYRNRVLFLASKLAVPLPMPPKATNSFNPKRIRWVSGLKKVNAAHASSVPSDVEGAILPMVTIADFISDLPEFDMHMDDDIVVDCGFGDPVPYKTPPNSFYQKMLRSGGDGHVSDHVAKNFSPSIRGWIKHLPRFGGAYWKHLPPDVRNRYEAKHSHSLQNYRKNAYGRMRYTEIFSTIVANGPHPQNGAILHPQQHRAFSVREFARGQGFPDWFTFCGIDSRDKYHQVGNAVPVGLARAIGKTLLEAFRSHALHLLTPDEKTAFEREQQRSMEVMIAKLEEFASQPLNDVPEEGIFVVISGSDDKTKEHEGEMKETVVDIEDAVRLGLLNYEVEALGHDRRRANVKRKRDYKMEDDDSDGNNDDDSNGCNDTVAINRASILLSVSYAETEDDDDDDDSDDMVVEVVV